eukprot:TRINITY_DN8716_c2_g1_i1.p1 TRINITY_DN8716_c2_g1~~TRINITY_DN8716_c2_g1_i1.p1  ORF type:complete len:776 (+),score=218.40 TRINITY_DN8716_c2_g1_i1:90-2330(+)
MVSLQEKVPYGLPRRLVLDVAKLVIRGRIGRSTFAVVSGGQYGEPRSEVGVAMRRSLLTQEGSPWVQAMGPLERERQRELVAREIQQMVQLGPHPRLARCIGFTLSAGLVDQVAIELATGSLRDFLHVRRPHIRKLRPPELVRVLRHAAVGVEHLHAHGLLHGNLTAGNVLVFLPAGQPQGTADGKLCDFGVPLSERVRGVDAPVSPYAAPETAGDEGNAYGPPADVFSMGVVITEAGCGRAPGEACAASPTRGVGDGSAPSGSEAAQPDPYSRAGDVTAIQRPFGMLAAIARPCFARKPETRPRPAELIDRLADAESELQASEGLRIGADTMGLSDLADRLELHDREKREAMQREMKEMELAKNAAEDEKRKCDKMRAEEWIARQNTEQELRGVRRELDETRAHLLREQQLQARGKEHAARVAARAAADAPRADSPAAKGKKAPRHVPPTRKEPVGALEDWTVPRSGQYRFTLTGACGGTGNANMQRGGSGAVCGGTLRLKEKQVFLICVGIKGSDGAEGSGGGGGGASYVSDMDGNPMFVAGGGGGGGLGGAGQRAWLKEAGGDGGGEIGGGGAGGKVTEVMPTGVKASFDSEPMPVPFGNGGVSGGAHVGGCGGGGWDAGGTGARKRGGSRLRPRYPETVNESGEVTSPSLSITSWRTGAQVADEGAAEGGKSRGDAGSGGFGGGGAGGGPGGGGGGGYCGGGGSCAAGGGCGGSFLAKCGGPSLKRGSGTADGSILIEFVSD